MRTVTSFHKKKLNQNVAKFYKSHEFKYKSIQRTTVPKLQKQQVFAASNPWRTLPDKDVKILVERLNDDPVDLYNAVKKRIQAKKRKFKMLNMQQQQKENMSINRKIQRKKKQIEMEFHSLMKQRKQGSLKINLPNLNQVKYVFGDRLMHLKKDKPKLRFS